MHTPMRRSTLAWVVMTALGLAACDIINPEEPIPAFIYIPAFSVETSPEEGSSSDNIRELWLTVDGQSLGAYRIPNAVPILTEGSAEIRLQAGIRDNGITLDPNIYPFYAPATFTRELVPGETDTLPLVEFRYLEETQFAFVEDFEDDLAVFEGIERSTAEVFEGEYAGRIELDTLNTVVRLATIGSYSNLTALSPQVYVEMDYRSDVPVAVGVAGQPDVPGFPTVALDAGFLPNTEWNKIYFSLGGLLQQGQFGSVQIVLEAFLTDPQQLGPDGVARVYLDNIKLVHF